VPGAVGNDVRSTERRQRQRTSQDREFDNWRTKSKRRGDESNVRDCRRRREGSCLGEDADRRRLWCEEERVRVCVGEEERKKEKKQKPG
jgi:hypothetical protein